MGEASDMTTVVSYDRYLNRVSKARQRSSIRAVTEQAKGMLASDLTVNLSGGLPNNNFFPIVGISLKLSDGTIKTLDEDRVKVALQYGYTVGQPDMLEWAWELQKAVHNPPTLTTGLDISICPGSADGLGKLLEMFVERGDYVITDSPTYSGALESLRPLGSRFISVPCDEYGMSAEALRKSLSSRWTPADAKDPNSDIPKFMYVIPTGSNPAGTSMTLERKKNIYQIAQEYNLLIIEDDPYYYLQFSDLVPSFLSLDVDGRVIRLDSLSKVVAPGPRVGFITGPRVIIERYKFHLSVSSEQTATLSQVLIHDVIKDWGIDGFLAHTRRLAAYYESQKTCVVKALDQYMKDFAEWNEPAGGFFLWLKLKHVQDTRTLMPKLFEQQVLLVPGCAFNADDKAPNPCFRLSFSLASADQIQEGIRRLASILREEMTHEMGHAG